ncbi:ATP-binding cassette domain-containing protein [Streptomyces sp. NPDC088358]|uniref:ATP-binding cassette domain-containing protein n=1 Tax=Streptomyces sp. NPDC088358 TaxID=3365857 RepID=UPI0037FD7DBC
MDGPHGLGVTATDFGLEGPRGWTFRGVEVSAEPGSLIAVEGPSGSGRTCLLLALTGRMRPTEGRAVVGGSTLPKQMAAVRRASALAHVPGVTDLDPALTVGEHLLERALLRRRFGGPLRGLWRPRAERNAETERLIDDALTAAGLDREALPKGSRTAVRDLERLESLRLSVALALVGRPGLLGVDDTDLKLSDAERADAWALLASLAASGTTVLAVCSEAPEGAVTVSTGRTGKPTGPGDDPDETGAPRTADDADETGAPRRADDPDAPRTADAPGGTAEPRAAGGLRKTAEPPATDEKETADALTETGRS